MVPIFFYFPYNLSRNFFCRTFDFDSFFQVQNFFKIVITFPGFQVQNFLKYFFFFKYTIFSKIFFINF